MRPGVGACAGPEGCHGWDGEGGRRVGEPEGGEVEVEVLGHFVDDGVVEGVVFADGWRVCRKDLRECLERVQRRKEK